MKQLFRRVTAFALSAVMVLGLAACDKTGGSSTQGDDEKITLRLGISANANVSEWQNNKLVLWLEEMTGYNLEVETFATDASERNTQVSTMVAGGEPLPDIMAYFAFSTDIRNTYGKDGYLYDLSTLFEDTEFMAELADKYDFDLMEYVDRNCEDEVKARWMTEGRSPEGALYGFPSLGAAITDQPRNMLFINQKWLTDLDLEMPRSIDELKAVLHSFIENDPNGNGKADEMGMVGSVNIARGDIPSWLINNFIYLDDTYMFNCTDEGEIYIPYDRDEYREGIKTVKEFYDEGLIGELTWTIKEASELPALFSPADEVSKIGVWAGHPYIRVTQDNPTLFEYTGLIPFEGANAAYAPLSVSYNTYISAESEHIKEAFEILYLLATPEGTRRQRYGVPGEDWEWADCLPDCEHCGGKGINGDGKAMRILNEDAYGGQTDSTFGQNIITVMHLRDEANPAHADRDGNSLHWAEEPDDGVTDWGEYRSELAYDHATGYMQQAQANNPKNQVFTLIYNADEIEEMGNFRTEIKTYAKEMRAKFIIGELDIDDDAEWKKYVDTIHGMGWDTTIECAQAAWDRMHS